jgi:O-acetylserine/cysteine efflux transporter
MSSNRPTIPAPQILAVGGVSQAAKRFGAGDRLSNVGAPLPILALTVLTLIWGASVPMMKLGLRDLSPLALVSWRYVCAAPLFGLLLLGRKLPGRKVLASLAGMAALGLSAGQILQIIGIGFSSAAIATIITGAIPIFTVLLGALRLRQRVRPRHVLGLAVAMGGIVLATGGAGATAGFGSIMTLLGDLILLLASICIAGYYVFSAEVALRVGVLQVSAWSTIFAAMYLSPVAIWTVSSGQIHPTGTAIGVVAYLSVLVTVVGISLWLFALRRLPVRVAASSQYIQPLIGVALSAWMFTTPLSLGFFIGTMLVVAGVGLGAAPARG